MPYIREVADSAEDEIYAYGGLGATSEQDIQDFSMKIRGSTGTLKICVRDHECEDGNRIRGEVNGRSIFSGEIDNDWDCYTLDVWAGESYAVELTALNGTGYKGTVATETKIRVRSALLGRTQKCRSGVIAVVPGRRRGSLWKQPDDNRQKLMKGDKMYRHCICIGVLVLLSLPLWSQQDTGDSVPSPGETFQDCDECPKMVVVSSGRFTMGSSKGEAGHDEDEEPLRRVRIDYQFAVGVYEVTFDEWYACLDTGGCGNHIPDDMRWGRGNRPVMNVSWDDAQSYLRWLSARTGKTYRLLSEAEWEYVARAGTETAYSWGDSIGVNRANCDGCGSQWDDEKTAPVGSFAANAWGVYDMHGNVREWVQDCWNDNYSGAPSDGSAWESRECDRRVHRGGSWFYFSGDLRSAARNKRSTGLRSDKVGFRVARDF